MESLYLKSYPLLLCVLEKSDFWNVFQSICCRELHSAHVDKDQPIAKLFMHK